MVVPHKVENTTSEALRIHISLFAQWLEVFVSLYDLVIESEKVKLYQLLSVENIEIPKGKSETWYQLFDYILYKYIQHINLNTKPTWWEYKHDSSPRYILNKISEKLPRLNLYDITLINESLKFLGNPPSCPDELLAAVFTICKKAISWSGNLTPHYAKSLMCFYQNCPNYTSLKRLMRVCSENIRRTLEVFFMEIYFMHLVISMHCHLFLNQFTSLARRKLNIK